MTHDFEPLRQPVPQPVMQPVMQPVIPAKAGIHEGSECFAWIPAFAGMTPGGNP